MLLVFVDETSDVKHKQYLGFCIATINARFYPSLKKRAQDILRAISWDPGVEFKGSYLFSASRGCADVEVERRIEAARHLLDLNVARSNSRMRFYFGTLVSPDHGRDYLTKLPGLLAGALPKAPKGAGKNLIIVTCDERPDVNADELHTATRTSVEARGYLLFERVMCCRSTFDTVGLMFADLVAYLAGRIDNIVSDAELFEGLTPEQLAQDGRFRKLNSSTELIRRVKSLGVYRHTERGSAV